MPELGGYSGSIAIAVVCLLILIEEAGVPLPMFPGDGLLLLSSMVIAGGQISPWLLSHSPTQPRSSGE